MLDDGKVVKTVTVENNPFKNLVIQPWTEDAELVTTVLSKEGIPNAPVGHAGWIFTGDRANVTLTLDTN